MTTTKYEWIPEENLKRFSYDLYKADWKRQNQITSQEERNTLLEYYKETEPEDLDNFSFEDFLNEVGYLHGTLYVCYEEFLDSEFLDEKYMKKLLGKTGLYKEYLSIIRKAENEDGYAEEEEEDE